MSAERVRLPLDDAAKQSKPAPPNPAAKGNGEVCVVGCKWPPGLLLSVYEPRQESEVGPNGMRTVTRYRPLTDDKGEIIQVHIKGPGLQHCLETRPKLKPVIDFPIIANAALTYNVPKDFMQRWFEQNATTALVRNQQIWMYSDDASAKSQAKELEKELTGVEPIDVAEPGEPVPDKRLAGAKVQTGERHSS